MSMCPSKEVPLLVCNSYRRGDSADYAYSLRHEQPGYYPLADARTPGSAATDAGCSGEPRADLGTGSSKYSKFSEGHAADAGRFAARDTGMMRAMNGFERRLK